MTTTIFLSRARTVANNWREAFAIEYCESGPLSESVIIGGDPSQTVVFIDVAKLDNAAKKNWLESAVALEVKAVVLSPTPNDDEALEMIGLGAVGYGHSLAHASQLQAMQSAVINGGLWLGSGLMKKVLATLARNQARNEMQQPRQVDLLESLSERERSVAEEVARGATNQEISASLAIKERTVKAHITSIFSKLSVRNRVELALLFNNLS